MFLNCASGYYLKITRTNLIDNRNSKSTFYSNFNHDFCDPISLYNRYIVNNVCNYFDNVNNFGSTDVPKPFKNNVCFVSSECENYPQSTVDTVWVNIDGACSVGSEQTQALKPVEFRITNLFIRLFDSDNVHSYTTLTCSQDEGHVVAIGRLNSMSA